MRGVLMRSLVVAALVAVGCAKVEKVEVKLEQPLLATAGQSTKAVATALDADGKAMEGKEFTFTSSDPAVAAVDAAGQVNAVKSGTATITATVGDKSGEAKVDVRIPAKIELEAAYKLSGIGAPSDVAAKVIDDAGREIPGAAVNFEVADPAIVSFSGKALTGLALGETKLKASFGSLVAEATVTVAQPEFATIEFGPATSTIKVGEKLPITFAAKTAEGAAVVGVLPTFASSDEKIATVAGGLVTAIGPGTATITTTVGDKTAEIKVTVKK